ncbi:hypothetical protein WICPIJ_002994 [Wickerhamomyces pijperi]|uniref:Mitochondrial import inner membrane translocase subunit Tim21 n=1 Tax=Wickerhamomyces pijperi TaxID=599730 RepID=A0A9P8QAD2_WICPI|nr:hypothetical protein WICPIJ_002994 [Wickerhamomyces pijperi]
MFRNSLLSLKASAGHSIRSSMLLNTTRRSLLIAQPQLISTKFTRFNSSTSSSSSESQSQHSSSTSAKDPKKTKKPSTLWPKIKTAFTFTFSTTLVIGAVTLSGLVIYLVLSELLLPSGDTQVFNHAVSLVEKDEKVQKLLGFEEGTRLKAYGETNGGDKWTRNRPIASQRSEDRQGKEHLFMRFNVEHDNKVASVQLETVQADVLHPEFRYIFVDVPGQKRVYVIEPPKQKSFIGSALGARDPGAGFLGVKWGPKKSD